MKWNSDGHIYICVLRQHHLDAPDEVPPIPPFRETTGNGIDLTQVIGGSELEVLNLVLTTEGEKIATKLFRKPTDGHQLVNWESQHQEHIKKSIPYGQMLRIIRNCTNEAGRLDTINELL